MKTIYDKDFKQDMTFEEVLERYKPLTLTLARNWNRYEDSNHLAQIFLWEAYEKYDDRGMGFAHYANQYLRRRFSIMHRDLTRPKRYSEHTCSLNVENDEHELIDMFGTESIEASTVLKMDLKSCLQKLSDKQRQIFLMACKGFSQSELSPMFNISQVSISRELRIIRKTLSLELN